jgi:hypothetical protein
MNYKQITNKLQVDSGWTSSIVYENNGGGGNDVNN